ncbi:MAG: hypothetical protein SchgKO_16070 [Schleiferiaceae bacterium]
MGRQNPGLFYTLLNLRNMQLFHPLRTFALASLLILSQYVKAEPIEDSVMVDFGYAVDSLIYNGYAKEFNKLFDKEAFFDRIIIEDEGNEKMGAFNMIFKLGFSSGFKLGEEIVASTEAGGIYTFISYFEEGDGLYNLVFSLFNGEGLNYHLLEVNYNDGNPVIEDIYIVITDEYLSETIGDLYFNALYEEGLVDYTDGSATGTSKDIDLCLKAKKEIKKENYEEALEILDEVSEEFRENKIYETLLITAAAKLDEDTYQKVLESTQIENPGLGHKYLMKIDQYFMSNEFGKGLANLDSLDDVVGDDPILDYYRGSYYLELKQMETAEIYFQKVQDYYPFSSLGYVGVLVARVERNEFDSATEQVRLMIELFSYTEEEIEATLEDYPKYLKSKPYKKLRKELF